MAPSRLSIVPPRERTIANIAFITTPPGAKIDIITSNAPDNSSSEPWRAIAIQSGRVRRTEVLNAGGRTEDEAMLALHIKASQAVHQFLVSNGPSYPPAYGPEYESDMDEEDHYLVGDEQEAEVLSDWGDAFSDESDGEDVAATRCQASKTVPECRHQKMHTPATRKLRPRLQKLGYEDSCPIGEETALKRRRNSDADMARPRIAKTGLQHAHDPPADGRAEPQTSGDAMKNCTSSKSRGKFGLQATTADESQLTGQQTTIASHQIVATQATTRQVADNLVAVDPPLPTKTTHQPAQYPVRLTISTSTSHSLAHHSPVYQLITTLPAPSMRALVGSAVGYIRTMPIPGVAEARPVPTLRARVKRVKMDDVMWDMGGFRADDLTIFFPSESQRGGQAMPLFELEVEDATGAQAAASCVADEYAGVLSG